MAGFLGSFFDEEVADYKLWQKSSTAIDVSKEKIILSDSLFKLSQKSKKWKSRHFTLTSKYLFYYKDKSDKQYRGYMEIEWVRTAYISKENADDQFQFGIRFIKNGKYSDLWTNSEEDYQKWKLALAQVCIQCDFHLKFNAIKMIGKGSFARVYLVENNLTKKKHAVKAFSKDYLSTQHKGKESLINEISIMRELNHPNIMRLEEIHESQNSIYLIIELLEGGELLTTIVEKHTLKLPELGKVLRDVLAGLAYIDKCGIMHRDLKPENLILKNKGGKLSLYEGPLEENVIKICDFGLATKYNISEYMFKRCGTPGFVAPEVINAPSNQNIKYNAKCDVYSAGVIFYLMVTGRGPFEGKSFQDILNKNKAAIIDFTHKNLAKLPPSGLDLLKRMLSVKPADRPSCAECLKHEFLFQKEDSDISVVIEDEGVAEQIKDFQDKYKANFRSMKNKQKQNIPNAGLSIEFRAGDINGHTDTIQESTDFDPASKKVDSLNFVGGGKKLPGSPPQKTVKRESIYKAALLAQLKNANLEEVARASESMDSQSEGTNSDDDGMDDAPKKSRFGPKH